MATLKHKQQSKYLYLKSFHRFGRLKHSVDSCFDELAISRIHAVIEWQQGYWFLRDLSRNGTWLNDVRVPYNQDVALNINDEIRFSDSSCHSFSVTDLAPPEDLLVPYSHDELVDGQEPVIQLENYHLLPSESDPELIVYFNSTEQTWCYEEVGSEHPVSITDGEQLRFAQQVWSLIQTRASQQECTAEVAETDPGDLEYLFTLSQDEEYAELQVKQAQEKVDFETRTHHYLTALLARYKVKDMQHQVDDASQGWVSVKQLSRDLGLTESHINIQIHRARKQFVDRMKDKSMAESLIERKRGRVRFGGRHFSIVKGQQLEASTLYQQHDELMVG
ncbi:FHA domain-containing protein [Pseudoalteromonas ardens]|uniref:FHA domain-containing protein n=1 Tax=Pseudoalteromonas rubra TaxID=43658 RepID=A0A0L0ERV9_9GAMM|nr:FHA domain-containing protein [Pseudoalteromonas sp. R96]KNC67151.1 hypothetical protein AC626_12620 [Pseudoalteromonas rubra]MDK1311022.1 FHA domain-containing protein [Pseudoalteromonas sp. R96]